MTTPVSPPDTRLHEIVRRLFVRGMDTHEISHLLGIEEHRIYGALHMRVRPIADPQLCNHPVRDGSDTHEHDQLLPPISVNRELVQ